MKHLLSLCGCLLVISSLSAQFFERHSIYLSNDLRVGNNLGAQVGLVWLIQSKYSISTSYFSMYQKPSALPDDFQSGFTGLIAPFHHYNELEGVQLCLGRNININSDTRLQLQAGIAYISGHYNTNYQKPGDPLLSFTPNYQYDTEKRQSLTLIINPRLELPFSRIYGLSFSPIVYINASEVYWGIGLGQMIGILKPQQNT